MICLAMFTYNDLFSNVYPNSYFISALQKIK